MKVKIEKNYINHVQFVSSNRVTFDNVQCIIHGVLSVQKQFFDPNQSKKSLIIMLYDFIIIEERV